MRHRKRGRTLGRSPSHRKAMLRNLASSLILTERDAEHEENTPKVKGRVVTTLPKAKEVRPLVEKCVTIARKSLLHAEEAEQYQTSATRGTADWREWRNGDQWQQWCAARAPVVAARRRALQLLGDKQAVQVLFDEIAPRFADRDGGYTRILRLAERRLGDAGEKAILEFVGTHDREFVPSERPSIVEEDQEPTEATDGEASETEQVTESDEVADADATTEDGAAEEDAADDATERKD